MALPGDSGESTGQALLRQNRTERVLNSAHELASNYFCGLFRHHNLAAAVKLDTLGRR